MNGNHTDYTRINSETVDQWASEGWEWGQPVSSEVCRRVRQGVWDVVLTPTKPVPHDWFCPLRGARVLGLASGGGQQMPVFSLLGAQCTVLDYSQKQLESEKMVAAREGYEIETVFADMTKGLPFEDEAFDLIFHPVSNCYIEDVLPLWRECFRVLKKGGILLAGVGNEFNYLFDEEEKEMKYRLPFNPLKDEGLFEESIRNGWGIQFSHSIEEQVGGQLKAGFILTDIFGDTNGSGRLHELGVPCYYATRAVRPR